MRSIRPRRSAGARSSATTSSTPARRRSTACGVKALLKRARRRVCCGGSEKTVHFRREGVFPASFRARGIRHVARGLFEIGHQTAPLEHFRQYVRDPLASDVRAAELCDRIVAVFAQHTRVQFVGAFGADGAGGDCECVAIGGTLDDGFAGNDTRAARPVVDDDRLAEALRQLLAVEPHQRVHAGARGQ